ncbi:hypothetical protein TanjilG_02690 [Lupinus angustifolius]|uniref:Uncharacterized protein n=1 Tax=Lupinus angustifolius TaxID=3871 RepID=A0A4P1RBU5_LUPAN|nr:hypothetical protein TanjilG_02690 [Lupinus angustifolius]
MQMVVYYLASRRMRSYGYEKLTSENQKMARPGRLWVKAMDGRLRGLRLSRSRKLSLRAFSAILLPRRKLVRIYNDFVNQMNLENMCSAIVLPTQWGLPVCRNVISLDRI